MPRVKNMNKKYEAIYDKLSADDQVVLNKTIVEAINTGKKLADMEIVRIFRNLEPIQIDQKKENWEKDFEDKFVPNITIGEFKTKHWSGGLFGVTANYVDLLLFIRGVRKQAIIETLETVVKMSKCVNNQDTLGFFIGVVENKIEEFKNKSGV